MPDGNLQFTYKHTTVTVEENESYPALIWRAFDADGQTIVTVTVPEQQNGKGIRIERFAWDERHPVPAVPVPGARRVINFDIFDEDGQELTTFDPPLRVEIPYTGEDTDRVNGSGNLQLYHYDHHDEDDPPMPGVWNQLERTDSTSERNKYRTDPTPRDDQPPNADVQGTIIIDQLESWGGSHLAC